MKLLLLTIIVLFTAGCSSSTSAPVVHNPSLAGQGVFLEASQIAYAASVAQASEEAEQTQAAIDATHMAATQSAEELDLAIAQHAATQAAKETALAFSITEAVATRSADATTSAGTATQAAQAITAIENKNSQSFWWWWWVIALTLIVGVVLWRLSEFGNALVEWRKLQNPRAIRMPGGGLLIIIQTPDGRMEKEIIPRQQPQLPPGPTDEDEFDGDGEQPEDTIPFYDKGNLQNIINRDDLNSEGVVNEGNRSCVMRFLRDAANIRGANSNTIPGHTEMGMSGAAWTRAIRLLGDNIQTQRGVGTWLIGEYKTINEMYQAVGERRFIPRVTIDNPPAPTAVPMEM